MAPIGGSKRSAETEPLPVGRERDDARDAYTGSAAYDQGEPDDHGIRRGIGFAMYVQMAGVGPSDGNRLIGQPHFPAMG